MTAATTLVFVADVMTMSTVREVLSTAGCSGDPADVGSPGLARSAVAPTVVARTAMRAPTVIARAPKVNVPSRKLIVPHFRDPRGPRVDETRLQIRRATREVRGFGRPERQGMTRRASNFARRARRQEGANSCGQKRSRKAFVTNVG